ncbi:MAG: sigma-70 family RNA polymerase sigma factor [Planctomycetota bacterium]
MSILPNRIDLRFARFCRTGDPKALGAVFDATAPELLRIAAWLVGDRDDAEDLVQRTFLTAIEQRAAFAQTRRVMPWLVGMLGNHARNLRRERARRAALAATREVITDPQREAAAAEFAAQVTAARRALGTPYAEVLDLHLGDGLNANQIAARLGRPAGTVRTQLVRGLEQLRRRLPSGVGTGLVVIATVASNSLAQVRAAVVAQAAKAPALLAKVSAWAPGQLLAASAIVLVASVSLGAACWPEVPQLPTPPTTAPGHTDVAAVQPAPVTPPQRVAAMPLAPPQDPVPVTPPTAMRLGPLPADAIAIGLDASGARSGAADARGHEHVVLQVDRHTPWRAVTALVGTLQRDGVLWVHFAARLPDGRTGSFAMGLPATATAGPGLSVQLHRRRPGVPADNLVPVLQRLLRGRDEFVRPLLAGKNADDGDKQRFPEPFAIGVTAPGDAPFEQVQQVLGAIERAGATCLLLTSDADESDATQTGAATGAMAIDIGPLPSIAVAARAVPGTDPLLSEFAVGCLQRAEAPPPVRGGGGAGGRYGGRGSRPSNERDGDPVRQIDRSLTWLASVQQPDGSFADDGGRADLEATTTVALALLGHGVLLERGEHAEMLGRAIGWLLTQQQDDGRIVDGSGDDVRLHALATLALAEAYGLDYLVEVRGGLCDALRWLAAQRREDGGFPRRSDAALGDVETTADAVMALATAEFFAVPTEMRGKQVTQWLAQHDAAERASDAAAASFARMFVGEDPRPFANDAAFVAQLLAIHADDDAGRDCWITHTLYQLGEEPWKVWSDRLRQLGEAQLQEGALAGSWQPVGGLPRTTTTALRTLSLECYRRFSRFLH